MIVTIRFKEIITGIARYLICLMCLANTLGGVAQNVTVRGRADLSYAGQVVQLYTFTDGLTDMRQKEDQDTVQRDGFFELQLQADHTQPVLVTIGRAVGKMYVEPDFVYGVTVPAIDKTYDYNNGAELPVNIGIVGSDSTELNALIFDYEGLYSDFFTTSDNRYLSRAVMFKRADSLKRFCDQRYATIKNEYFHNYVEYSIASVNASLSRGENFLINGYIVRRPILYRHYEYMKFFATCFSGYLKGQAASRKGQSLYNIVNQKSDYTALDNFAKQDRLLARDSLRELVLLKSLWEFYFSPEFDMTAVETLLGELNRRSTIAEHKTIAGRMLAYINKLQAGAPAPGFAARSKDGTMATLASYKNRWVYLNFFSTANAASLREMPKIAALKKKFGDKVAFVSVCVDDSLKTYLGYVKTNPRFDWAILYNNDRSLTKTASDAYFITGSEGYFLINPKGELVQAPALSPSQGIEYKFNTLFKSIRRTTKTGIR